MTATVTTWRGIPADKLIRLLGEKGDGFHPRDICDPAWIHDKFGIPLELLPVDEIVADADRGIHLERNGKPVACMQGIVAGDLIDAIAAGLAVEWPADARRGYSGGRFDLAAAIVKHLKATLTMAEMIDRAISDGDALGELTYTRFLPGTVLSPGLAAMLKQGDGVYWMLSAIASWVTCGASDGGDGQFDDDGMNPGVYRRLIQRWPDLQESMQMFDLRRHGQRGAELCVRGGADLTEDDSNTLHPIQRWVFAQIPWSDDEPFRVWAGRQQMPGGRAVWVLMLPREY